MLQSNGTKKDQVRCNFDIVRGQMRQHKILITEFLHTDLNQITLRPWGAKEFALMDKQLDIIIIQQWD